MFPREGRTLYYLYTCKFCNLLGDSRCASLEVVAGKSPGVCYMSWFISVTCPVFTSNALCSCEKGVANLWRMMAWCEVNPLTSTSFRSINSTASIAKKWNQSSDDLWWLSWCSTTHPTERLPTIALPLPPRNIGSFRVEGPSCCCCCYPSRTSSNLELVYSLQKNSDSSSCQKTANKLFDTVAKILNLFFIKK